MRLSRQEWRNVGGMAAVVAVLHVVGWGCLLFVVAPGQHAVGQTEVFGVGLGVTAYVLGVRHAFDVDHIAAIDNTTRKLMSSPRRPLSVGFWFALGHSTVVVALCVVLALGVAAVAGPVADSGSTLQQTAGFVGSLVAGTFLLLIGVINLVVLRQIFGVFRRMRTGEHDPAELERRLDERGLLNRVLRPLTRSVRRPAHIYPIGLLFGLGFDTATEVALLVLAGGAAAAHLPWYAILTLPILFTAGMTLLDAANGCAMTFAYGWSFVTPARKVFYNLAVTGLSVAIALLIGGVQLLGLLAERLDIGALSWIAGIDLASLGYAIVGLLIGTWLLAVAFWRIARVEQRYGHAE